MICDAYAHDVTDNRPSTRGYLGVLYRQFGLPRWPLWTTAWSWTPAEYELSPTPLPLLWGGTKTRNVEIRNWKLEIGNEEMEMVVTHCSVHAYRLFHQLVVNNITTNTKVEVTEVVSETAAEKEESAGWEIGLLKANKRERLGWTNCVTEAKER